MRAPADTADKDAPSAKVIRAALGSFSTERTAWQDLMNCEAWAAALQPLLMDVEGIEWVERREIDLALRELSLGNAGLLENADHLRLGRLVREHYAFCSDRAALDAAQC